ncbi:unnamed protein product [Rotaria sordida]|uniref:Uncharacterized protein n=1 Tax=Rotaria sordida TaxID=392033 RepID=A0A815IGS7_9BILA|nr:unnamed protein product [Rotaria sordida]CAF3832491.1 unnamed protein product [Rotaria sordida]
MDQFLVTSSNASLRHISKIQRAYKIVLITSIIWVLHSLVGYFNVGISLFTGACVPNSPGSSLYAALFFIFIISVISITITMIFRYLTYRNICQTTVLAEQQADRQVASFYAFLISSSRFRQTVKERLFRWRSSNQVHPPRT